MILYEAEMQLKKTKAPLFLRISIKNIQHLKSWRSFEIMNGVKNCVKKALANNILQSFVEVCQGEMKRFY